VLLFESASEHGNGYSLCFLFFSCFILERQELFPRRILPIKPRIDIFSLFMSCSNIWEILDLDLFWACDGLVCGDFPTFLVVARRVANFFVAKKLNFFDAHVLG